MKALLPPIDGNVTLCLALCLSCCCFSASVFCHSLGAQVGGEEAVPREHLDDFHEFPLGHVHAEVQHVQHGQLQAVDLLQAHASHEAPLGIGGGRAAGRLAVLGLLDDVVLHLGGQHAAGQEDAVHGVRVGGEAAGRGLRHGPEEAQEQHAGDEQGGAAAAAVASHALRVVPNGNARHAARPEQHAHRATICGVVHPRALAEAHHLGEEVGHGRRHALLDALAAFGARQLSVRGRQLLEELLARHAGAHATAAESALAAFTASLRRGDGEGHLAAAARVRGSLQRGATGQRRSDQLGLAWHQRFELGRFTLFNLIGT
eukprot:scaffold7673_cov258-Pinguiococcus_pyrenoidosus.AAC.18